MPDTNSKKAEQNKAKIEEEYKPIFKISFVSELPKLPDMKDLTIVDVRYLVIDPYVTIHVYWDNGAHELRYDAEEPALNEKEKESLKLIEEGLSELINISYVNMTSEQKIIEFLEKNVRVIITEFAMKISEESFVKLMYYIYRDFIGLNIVEPLMRDNMIEDIECNGLNSHIYLVHRKYRNIRTNIMFTSMKQLTTFVEKLAQRCGQYVSYANPLLDGSLPNGDRVNATYTEDVTSHGPSFTIRRFTSEPWTPVKLMDFKTVSPEILAYIWMLVENKANMLIIGGTGSGKTSFLNAIGFFMPPAARIVSIEDTRELNMYHENWLPAVSRQGVGATTITGEKHGEVSLFDLLKESLRQRPDYIIVGEIRGKEAYVLFQAMASGHSSYGTMHAESVITLIRRLETPPISLSSALIENLDAVAFITPAIVNGKESRRLKEINEIVRIPETGQPIVNTPFVWNPATDTFLFKTNSKIFEKIIKRTGLTWDQLLIEFRARTRLLMELYRQKIFGFKEVAEIIQEYYKTPDAVLQRFGLKR